jgi:tryptophan-rich sensory protein
MQWYRQLNLPAITPPDYVFGMVWTIIYILATIAALLVWNKHYRNKNFSLIMGLFAVNAILNLSWSYFFFYKHAIQIALFDCIALAVVTLLLVYYIWPLSRRISALLVPYAIWTIFASYLNFLIWNMN